MHRFKRTSHHLNSFKTGFKIATLLSALPPVQMGRMGATEFSQTFGYELINQSELLPNLDVNLLTECVQNPNPLAAAKTFRQGIQQ